MNSESRQKAQRRFGVAWAALTLALAVHVADEAVNDFLSFWNPMVRSLRAQYGFFPMPTFTFEVWLGGLVLAVAVLLILSRWAFRGARWMAPLSYVFAVVMIGNGLLHAAASFYLGRAAPGVYSAPLLAAAGVWLLKSARACPRERERVEMAVFRASPLVHEEGSVKIGGEKRRISHL